MELMAHDLTSTVLIKLPLKFGHGQIIIIPQFHMNVSTYPMLKPNVDLVDLC